MKIISYEILGLDSENYRTKYFLSIGTENSRGQEDGNNKRQVLLVSLLAEFTHILSYLHLMLHFKE